MGFELHKKNEAEIEDTVSYYRHNSGMRPAKENSADSFWMIRIALAAIVPILLALPILIITFLRRFFKEKKSLRNKIVLLTGSGRGLGRKMALELAKEGAIVACVDIMSETNGETVDAVRMNGGIAEGYTVNVAKANQVEDLIRAVHRDLGPIDVLINNAALIMAMPASEWTEREIKAFYDVNVLAQFWLIKAVLPSMRKRQEGHIVTISSSAALFPVPLLPLYASTKAAISTLTDNLRTEMEMFGEAIKFTTVHPLFINTSDEVAGFCNFRIPRLNAAEVARIIVDAIMLEKENMTVPTYLWPILSSFRALPKLCKDLILFILRPRLSYVDTRIRNVLPYNNIVQDTIKSEK